MSKNALPKILIFVIITGIVVFFITFRLRESRLLNIIIERLTAESRIAEVIVSDVSFNPDENVYYTTIKFLEYDSRGVPLAPKYFTFSGNIIQFQSMVIRFDDFYVKSAHPLKGKSAYLFMKVFMLGEEKSEVFDITRAYEVPSGYEILGPGNYFERRLWRKFWDYALSPEYSRSVGVKSAQIEAPGTKFIPGILYTIKIEHDGGMRIEPQKLSPILNGEEIKF